MSFAMLAAAFCSPANTAGETGSEASLRGLKKRVEKRKRVRMCTLEVQAGREGEGKRGEGRGGEAKLSPLHKKFHAVNHVR